jgi:adhesin/invasin
VTLQVEYPKNIDEPAGGLSVAFKLGSTNGGQGTFGAVTDHGNGQYTAIFTGTIAGINTIKAYIDGHAVTSPPAAIKVVTGPLSLAHSPLTSSAASMKAGGTITVTWQPEDAGGNKLNLGSTPLPSFSLVSGNGTFGPVSHNSKTGTYSATFTTTTAGIYTVETTYNNQTATSKAPIITVKPGPVSLSNSPVKVSQDNVPLGSKVTVTLQAVDTFGNSEAAGLAISFMLGSGSAKGTFGKATYAGNGIYQATFTATKVGSTIIEALVGVAKVTSTASISVTPL